MINPKNAVASKPCKCFACGFTIPKGNQYIVCPSREPDGSTGTVDLCIECAYLLRYKTGDKAHSIKAGCFTEQRIPNCLRKLRALFRADPIKAIEAMMKADCPEEPVKPCTQIVVNSTEFRRKVFHFPEGQYKVEQFTKGTSITIKSGSNRIRTAVVKGVWSTDGSSFGCLKRQIALLVS